MSAPDFGRNQESLQLLSKQQHRGIRDPIPVQQIQVLQQLRRRRPLRKWELANAACGADELRHPLEIEIVQRGITARSRVKWPQRIISLVVDSRSLAVAPRVAAQQVAGDVHVAAAAKVIPQPVDGVHQRGALEIAFRDRSAVG